MRCPALGFLALAACSDQSAEPLSPAHRELSTAEKVATALEQTERRAVRPDASPFPSPSRPLVVVPPREGWPVVRGRVVDARTGVGVEGCRVRVQGGDEFLSEGKSDLQGHLALTARPKLERATICALPDSPWRWRRSGGLPWMYTMPLPQAQAAGEQEVVLEVAERRVGTLRGVARAVLDGAPIPDHRFEIATRPLQGRPARTHQVAADAEGRYSISDLQGGRVRLRAIPGQAPPAKNELDLISGLAEDTDLFFDVGPVVRLALEGEVPDDPAALRVQLYRPGFPRCLVDSALRPTASGFQARLDARACRVRHDPELVLAVVDADGMRCGALRVRWTELADGTTRCVAIAHTGVVRVTTRAGGKGSPPERYRGVRLQPVGDLEVDPWRLHLGRWLPPGQYELVHRERGMVPRDYPLTLPPGQVRTVVFVRQELEEVRRVRVLFQDETGEGLLPATLTLSLRDRPWNSWNGYLIAKPLMCGTGIDAAALLDKPVDPREGHFVYDQVPPGELEVSLKKYGGYLEEPHRVEISGPPDGEQLVTVTRFAYPRGFGFRWDVDAVPYARLTTRVLDGGEDPVGAFAAGGIAGPIDPRTRRFEWALESWGRRPVFGDQESFVEVEPGRWFADIDFEPGCEFRLTVRDEEGRPLPGVLASAAGRELGLTDADGRLQVIDLEDPDQLELELDGWVVTGGSRPERFELEVGGWVVTGPARTGPFVEHVMTLK